MKSLGIDIGTTSISIVLMETSDQKLIYQHTIPNSSIIEADNEWERLQDAKIIAKIVLEEVKEIINNNEVSYIGLTGQMHGILYIDENGNALSPLYTWQDESGNRLEKEGISYVDQLRKITKEPVASGFGSVTYYVHQKQNKIPENACKICTIADYIGLVLTGEKEPILDLSNAASIGLFDKKKQEFLKEKIEKTGLGFDMFPRVAKKQCLVGETKEGIPVGIAIGDNQASFMGAMNEEDFSNNILINIGTGSQISFLLPRYMELKNMETRPFKGEKYLAVASPLCGGRAYSILEKFYEQVICGYNKFSSNGLAFTRDHIYAWMDSLLEGYEEREEEVIIKPQFSGTRDNPKGRGSIGNISTINFTPEDFTIGMLLGIVEELYNYYNDNPDIHSFTGMVGSGNGLRKNKHLIKMFEKKFAMSMKMSRNEEEAACGVALNIIN